MWDKPVHVSVLFLISQQLPGSKGHWEGEFVSLVPPGSLGFSWKMHPEGSLGAAGRRCCCPLPLPGTSYLCSLQTQGSCSQQQTENPGGRGANLQSSRRTRGILQCFSSWDIAGGWEREPLGLPEEGGAVHTLPQCQFSHTWSSWLLQTSQLTSLTFPKPPWRIPHFLHRGFTSCVNFGDFMESCHLIGVAAPWESLWAALTSSWWIKPLQ